MLSKLRFVIHCPNPNIFGDTLPHYIAIIDITKTLVVYCEKIIYIIYFEWWEVTNYFCTLFFVIISIMVIQWCFYFLNIIFTK